MNIEKELSYEEFVDLMALAESFRQYDDKREHLLAEYPETTKGMSIQTFLKEAESLGISKEHGLRAISTRFPSFEKQLAEIREHNGTPSIKLIFDVYSHTIKEKLEKTVAPKFGIEQPGDSTVYHPCLSFYRNDEETVVKRGFITEKSVKIAKRIPLAHLQFVSDKHHCVPLGKFYLDVKLKDPIFLRVFGEDILRLNDYFKRKGILHAYEVTYDYEQNPLFADIKK
jgi:hypothetical protein